MVREPRARGATVRCDAARWGCGVCASRRSARDARGLLAAVRGLSTRGGLRAWPRPFSFFDPCRNDHQLQTLLTPSPRASGRLRRWPRCWMCRRCWWIAGAACGCCLHRSAAASGRSQAEAFLFFVGDGLNRITSRRLSRLFWIAAWRRCAIGSKSGGLRRSSWALRRVPRCW